MHTPFFLSPFMKQTSVAVPVGACAGPMPPLYAHARRGASVALSLPPVAAAAGGVVALSAVRSTGAEASAVLPHALDRALPHGERLM